MKNINKTTKILAIFGITVFIFGLVLVPSKASAQVYYGNNPYNAYPYNSTYPYNTYPYNNYYNSYAPLQVSCSANTTSTNINSSVVWSAYASGGNGYYNYSWTGTDGLYGYGQSISNYYSNAGQKYASVTVTSNGQTVTMGCNNSVYVNYAYSYPYNSGYYQNGYYIQPSYQPYNAYSPYVSSASALPINCSADPATATVGQPVTWTASVSGSNQYYNYAWTGSDGLNGSQASVIKYYDTAGEKSAVVTVTAQNGTASSKSCSNTVTVRSAYAAAPRAAAVTSVAPAQTESPAQSNTSAQSQQSNQQNQNQLSASSFFSLSNVPWGWVAILVIVVLFVTVIYLIFNRQKI